MASGIFSEPDKNEVTEPDVLNVTDVAPGRSKRFQPFIQHHRRAHVVFACVCILCQQIGNGSVRKAWALHEPLQGLGHRSGWPWGRIIEAAYQECDGKIGRI